MSIIPHLSSLAALEKWVAQSTDLEIFDVCHNEFYSFAGICKSRLWAARVRFYLNGPADKITTGYNQFDLLQDIRPLRYLPVHWDVHSHGVVTCGLCLEEMNDSCKVCRNRREIMAELATRAQQLIIHKPILADIVGHIVGQLASMSADLLIQMPTLAFGMGSR
jgi:hypothetical protein